MRRAAWLGLVGWLLAGLTEVVEAQVPYSLVRTIPNPSGIDGDLFGYAIADPGDGEHVLVTSVFAPDGSGEAYLFHMDDGSLVQTFSNPAPDILDAFGFSAAAFGSSLVLGAPLDDSLGATDAGASYVFNFAGTLLQTLGQPAPSVEGLSFGYAIAPLGNDLLVGLLYGGDAYRIDGVTGLATVAYEDPNPELGGDTVSVAYGGGLVYVGHRSRQAAQAYGLVHVYDADTGVLLRTLEPPAPDFDGFGAALLASGSTVVVGVPNRQPQGLGAAVVIDGPTGDLLQVIENPNPVATDMFGTRMALSGDDYVIAAPGHESESGSIYVVDSATGNVDETIPSPLGGGGAFGAALAVIDGSIVASGLSPDHLEARAYVFTRCGDGSTQPGEACDDGNTDPDDGCSPLCVVEGGGGTTTTTSSTTTTTLPPDPATIAPPLDPTVATDVFTATEFLYTGPEPIQTGVASGTIDPRHAAVIRGRVLDRDEQPLGGVRIAIFDHPEFGQTLTRADGRFDLVVNGGGLLTVTYDRPGLLPARRQVDLPWQDYATAPDVVMVVLDAAVTAIDVATSTTMQVHQATMQTDADGSRQATLLFPAGTTATLIAPDGTPTVATTLNVRATEYTVGPTGEQAMPATLPPNSAYTYAVNVSADEAIASNAIRIELSEPAIFYVENFLGFGVGTGVPAGFYDRQRGVWVALENGLVVQVVGVTAGYADVDVTGDSIADTGSALTALGITDPERERLAQLYGTGQALWRVRLPHFTELDYNWPYRLSAGAEAPKEAPPDDDNPEDDPTECLGSVLECENQVLGERIPITGTPFALTYRSDRVYGREALRSLDIPVIGPVVPPGLRRIELEVDVAGRRERVTLPPVPSQRYVFTWDGLDVYGRRTNGAHPVTVGIHYYYDGFYMTRAPGLNSFGRYSPTDTPEAVARRQGSLSQYHQAFVRAFDAKGLGFGGWMLDVQHVYVPSARKLYLGTGERRAAETMGPVMATVAGQEAPGSDGDGGPAALASLDYVEGLATDRDGNLYVAAGDRIRRIDADGIISTVAGGGMMGPGNGGPATLAEVHPSELAVAPDGSLYFTEFNTIRRIDRDGIVTLVAGDGNPTSVFTGEGMPATQASLPGQLTGLAVGPDGTLYLGTRDEISIGANGLFQVGTDGLITTVAPTRSGIPPPGPAAIVGVYGAAGLATSPRGEIFVGDSLGAEVFRISSDGSLSLVAGGDLSDSGDGGQATQAGLEFPWHLGVTRDGSLRIAEGFTRRVRNVDSTGVIKSLAGRGLQTANGAAARASVAGVDPQAMAVAPDGVVYLGIEHRVRRIAPSLAGLTLGEQIIPSDDGRELYVLNGQGRHIRTLDGRTLAVRYELGLDVAGRLVSVTDVDGRVTTIPRLGDGRPTAIVAPGGQTTTLTLDTEGYLATVTNPAGETVQLTYDADGLLTGLRTPRLHDYVFTYDGGGRLTQDADPAGGTQTFDRSGPSTSYQVTRTTGLIVASSYGVARDAVGDKDRTITRPDGLTVTRQDRQDATRTRVWPSGVRIDRRIDPDPRFGLQVPVASVTERMPSGLQRQRAASRIAALADPLDPLTLTSETETVAINGKISTRTYDAATRTQTEVSPEGRIVTTSLDTAGRTASVAAAGLAPVTFTRNALGLVETVTQGTGIDARTTTITYDAQQRPALIEDSADRTIGFNYDAADRVTNQTFPDESVAGFTYDAGGNVASVTPPGRPIHVFSYTPIDHEETYTPPTIGGPVATSYTYNTDRQLTQIARPDGQIVSFGYDPGTGRLATRTTPIDTVTFGYHPTTGHLNTLTSTTGEHVAYAYDGSLRTAAIWTGPVAGTVGATYDAFFRVNGTTVNGSFVAPRSYDDDGLLTQTGVLSLTRHPDHGLVTATALGTVTDSRSYNAFGEITSYIATANGNPALGIGYVRDELGRIVERTESILGGTPHVTTYGYDERGRLETVSTDGSATVTYTYDANGNRLSRATSGGGLETATYDAQDRLLTYDGAVYTYTANGEVATKTEGMETTFYDYDALGNLREVTLPDGTLIEYVIDPENRRVGKMVNGTPVQGFLYDDQLRVAAELDGTGAIVSRFIYGIQPNVPEYLVKSSTTYRIITDHLGSPRLVVDASTGAILQNTAYDEFGRVTSNSNPGFQPFGFAGGLYDHDTRIVRFGARDFDAGVGRWTSKDPVRFRGGQANLVEYAFSDPVNETDPAGLAALGVCLAKKYLKDLGDPDDAWEAAYDDRQKMGIDNEALRNAEHYLWANQYVADDPSLGRYLAEIVAVTGWSAMKLFGEGYDLATGEDEFTTPTLDELVSGYTGAAEAYFGPFVGACECDS
jgi:RHS repeat-associated protein